MKKIKLALGSIAVISVLSLSGCCLLDPFWFGGPHDGGGGYSHGGGEGGHGGGPGGDRGGW